MAKARGLSKATVLRRNALRPVIRAVADGFSEVGHVLIEQASARAPDSPFEPYPTGEGLPKQGGYLVYVEGQKVDGWSIRGPQPQKPRSARVIVRENAIVLIAGFGFPARFNETGTVDTTPQPFFGPTNADLAPRYPTIIGHVAKPKIGGNR